MQEVFNKLKGGLIVSCQAEGDSPFNNPEGVKSFAICAQMGGAAAIRSEGIEKTKAIVEGVQLPVIGLVKTYFEDGMVCITRSFEQVEGLLNAGCHIIAIDGTFREKEKMSGPEFIREVKRKYNCCIMADIATYTEAMACVEAGADCISTTLSGYTPETAHLNHDTPNIELLQKLVAALGETIPVIAEGRFNTPLLASDAMRAGAWAVVVGTAITRPQTITKWFYDAVKNAI